MSPSGDSRRVSPTMEAITPQPCTYIHMYAPGRQAGRTQDSPGAHGRRRRRGGTGAPPPVEPHRVRRRDPARRHAARRDNVHADQRYYVRPAAMVAVARPPPPLAAAAPNNAAASYSPPALAWPPRLILMSPSSTGPRPRRPSRIPRADGPHPSARSLLVVVVVARPPLTPTTGDGRP